MNYRPLIPVEYRNDPLYAVPANLMMKKEKLQKSEKKMSMKQLKGRQKALESKLEDV